jgi:hypothetical protein
MLSWLSCVVWRESIVLSLSLEVGHMLWLNMILRLMIWLVLGHHCLLKSSLNGCLCQPE